MQHLQETGGGVSRPNLELARSNRADGLAQSSCKKAMSTGDGTSTTCPVAVRPPVPGSILKTTMLFENWFSASRYLPLGSIAKCLGSLPPVGTLSSNFNVPPRRWTLKTAMVSLPRFEVYRNLPDGWMAISAASLRPENFFGRAEIRWKEVGVNRSVPTMWNAVTVDFSSPKTYMRMPSLENTACLGPVPRTSFADGSFGFTVGAQLLCTSAFDNVPFVTSN